MLCVICIICLLPILPSFVLRGICGKWSVTEICVFFLQLRRVRTVHLGFINTENKGQILHIVAHPFQQHFSKNKSEYDKDIPQYALQTNPRHREEEPHLTFAFTRHPKDNNSMAT